MNNIFSWNRFTDVLSLEVVSRRRKLLLYSAVMTGILIVAALMMSSAYKFEYARGLAAERDIILPGILNLYLVFLFIFGAISASLMWAVMKNKVGRISLIMNPATSLEKYLVKWTVYFFGFLIVFALSFFIAETVRYFVFHALYPEADICPLYLAGKYDSDFRQEIMRFWNSSLHYVIAVTVVLFLLVQSLFVLGASIWYRNSFIKTFVGFGCVLIVLFILAVWTGTSLSHGKIGTLPWFIVWIGDHKYEIFFIVAPLFTVFNWVVAYFRIQETDIISTKR